MVRNILHYFDVIHIARYEVPFFILGDDSDEHTDDYAPNHGVLTI